jgi:hypothetical protein
MKPSHHEHTEILGWISFHLDGHTHGKYCKRIVLPLTDSTLAVGWILKSNFGDVHPMHLQVARAMAELIMGHDSTVYSQGFKGILNKVTDALSHDHHLPNKKLLNLFHSFISERIPSNLISESVHCHQKLS